MTESQRQDLTERLLRVCSECSVRSVKVNCASPLRGDGAQRQSLPCLPPVNTNPLHSMVSRYPYGFHGFLHFIALFFRLLKLQIVGWTVMRSKISLQLTILFLCYYIHKKKLKSKPLSYSSETSILVFIPQNWWKLSVKSYLSRETQLPMRWNSLLPSRSSVRNSHYSFPF